MSNLLAVSEARQKLLNEFSPAAPGRVWLSHAAGRVLAEDIPAGFDLPSFSNSSMDGFAVRASDLESASPGSPVILRVVGDIPAGQAPGGQVSAGEAIRIMTGAPLPEGAEAVVPVEDTDFNHRDPGTPPPAQVAVFHPVKAGDNLRLQGQDLRAGEVVLPAGRRLRPQDVGVLAMLGVAEVSVYRRPRVALVSTGDELLPVEAPPQPGKVFDSNSYTLAALIERDGGEAVYLGIAKDTQEAVQSRLDRAVSEGVDAIISTAGVSVGAFDYVRMVVEKYGRLSFWRVNMRPGKPLAFGRYRNLPFIGLPGNPVSAFVGYEVFIRPALLKMNGMGEPVRATYPVVIQEPIESDGRESYLRAIVWRQDRQWLARLTGHQGSGNLRSLVRANALLIVPSGVKSLPVGAEVEAWFLEEPAPGSQPGK